MYLQDITETFWNFIKDVNNNFEERDIKSFKSYIELDEKVKTSTLMFIHNSNLLPQDINDEDLPKNTQRLILPPNQCIYVFPSIHDTFLGMKKLLQSSKNKTAFNAIKKTIKIIYNYIETDELSDKLDKI
jgi:hypothetical protein